MIREFDRLVDVVRHEHDRLVQARLQRDQLILESSAHDGIDGAVRLVHQQDRRICRQRAGHAHALLLSARELGRIAIQQLRVETDEVDQLTRAVAHAGFVPSEQRWHGGDVGRDRLVREQTCLLDHVADPAAELVHRQVDDAAALHLDRPAGGFDEAIDHLQRRRLATSGRTDERGQTTLRELETQVADRWVARTAEALRNAVEPDGDFSDFATLRRRRSRRPLRVGGGAES